MKERGQSGLAQQHGVVGRAEKAQVGHSFENSFWEVKPAEWYLKHEAPVGELCWPDGKMSPDPSGLLILLSEELVLFLFDCLLLPCWSR